MIKFFRKIRQKLLSQHKVTQYAAYALGEIFLVVIGILIALQVNTWNEDRVQRSREVKYLKNIRLDLEKDLASLDYQIANRKEKYAAIQKLLRQVDGKPVADLDELSRSVVTTLMSERFTPNNLTYKELASSGNLNLISNDSIKIQLLELEELYKTNEFIIEHETHDYEEYLSKPLFKHIRTGQLFPVYAGTATSVDMGVKEEDFNELLQNREYQNGMVVSNLITEDLLVLYGAIERKSRSIIRWIGNDLGE